MKTVARITLKAGDILGEDILNSQGERIYAKGTKLDLKALDRLARYNVMAVTIMEDIDFAETHTEKVKASDDFKNFKNVYYECVPVFRKIIDNLVIDHTTPPIDQLMGLYIKLASNAPTGDKLLEYLVNIPPDMENMIYEHMLNCGMIASVFGNWLGLSKQELFMFMWNIDSGAPIGLLQSLFKNVFNELLIGSHMFFIVKVRVEDWLV